MSSNVVICRHDVVILSSWLFQPVKTAASSPFSTGPPTPVLHTRLQHVAKQPAEPGRPSASLTGSSRRSLRGTGAPLGPPNGPEVKRSAERKLTPRLKCVAGYVFNDPAQRRKHERAECYFSMDVLCKCLKRYGCTRDVCTRTCAHSGGETFEPSSESDGLRLID